MKEMGEEDGKENRKEMEGIEGGEGEGTDKIILTA